MSHFRWLAVVLFAVSVMITGCGQSPDSVPIESPASVTNSSLPAVSKEPSRRLFLSLPPMTTEQTEQPIRFLDLPPLEPPHDWIAESAGKIPELKYRWHREFEDLGVKARIVCHDNELKDDFGGMCLRCFAETEGRWQPAFEYVFQCSFYGFESFDVIRVKETGPTVRRDHSEGIPMFFSCVNTSGGSSSTWQYQLVCITPNTESKLRAISIDLPTETLKSLISETQNSEPDRTRIAFGNGAFWFSFSIWNEGDRSNFPTGGGVSGRMKLMFDADGQPSRLVVADWKQFFDEPAPADE